MRRLLFSRRFRANDTAVRETLLHVDAALRAASIYPDLRRRTQIALAEACNNIVEHAYGPHEPPKAQMIALEITGDHNGLHVTLRDHGRAMPDGPLPGGALPRLDPTNPQDLPEGGFGWAMLRKMTCALCVTRTDGQNVLCFLLPQRDGDSSDRNDT
jgi:serine/threonine-protein kinase RsbW